MNDVDIDRIRDEIAETSAGRLSLAIHGEQRPCWLGPLFDDAALSAWIFKVEMAGGDWLAFRACSHGRDCWLCIGTSEGPGFRCDDGIVAALVVKVNCDPDCETLRLSERWAKRWREII